MQHIRTDLIRVVEAINTFFVAEAFEFFIHLSTILTKHRMRSMGILGMILFILILFLIDGYTFKGLRDLVKNTSFHAFFPYLRVAYWVINLSFYAIWLYVFVGTRIPGADAPYKFIFTTFGIFLMFFIPKLVFSLFVLINDLGSWIVGLFSKKTAVDGEIITRHEFILYIGAFLASIPLISIGWGMLVGRYKFTVHREKLAFKNLPKALDGIKIVQISDLHIGSFYGNFDKVEKGLNMIRELKPDMIVFTGDLVNNTSKEAEAWIETFKAVEAPLGKYSVLGNHDYGEYVPWNSVEEKNANLDRLKKIHEEMGFDLLLNEHRRIGDESNSFVLAGVENWGLPPFPQHGDLDKALAGSTDDEFQILLSHDPSHFDARVTEGTAVDLTLSGHTHGMQFGVEIGDFKWSPVKYKYPKWAGLYKTGKQYLYVNRGFGYIGFPGRVGIMPEITLFELSSTA